MTALSDTVANALLDYAFGAGSNSAAPATYYVALSTTDPSSSVTEPSGGAYARVAVTNNSTNWPAAASRVKSNGTSIIFPTATASWGTIVGWALYDASTGGNLRWWGVLSASQAIASGGVPDFPSSQLSISA